MPVYHNDHVNHNNDYYHYPNPNYHNYDNNVQRYNNNICNENLLKIICHIICFTWLILILTGSSRKKDT